MAEGAAADAPGEGAGVDGGAAPDVALSGCVVPAGAVEPWDVFAETCAAFAGGPPDAAWPSWPVPAEAASDASAS